MSNSIAPGSSADVNVKVTALTTNPNVPVTYKTIILKKNLVNGVNTLTQEMMPATNTKYVIKYDYVLGNDITVPANCILEFDGGSISASGSNDTITGNNTGIQAGLVKIFNTNVTLAGTWNVAEAYPEWFGNINNEDCSIYINKCITSFNICFLSNKTYNIRYPIFINKDYVILKGKSSNSKIKALANFEVISDSDTSITRLDGRVDFHNALIIARPGEYGDPYTTTVDLVHYCEISNLVIDGNNVVPTGIEGWLMFDKLNDIVLTRTLKEALLIRRGWVNEFNRIIIYNNSGNGIVAESECNACNFTQIIVAHYGEVGILLTSGYNITLTNIDIESGDGDGIIIGTKRYPELQAAGEGVAVQNVGNVIINGIYCEAIGTQGNNNYCIRIKSFDGHTDGVFIKGMYFNSNNNIYKHIALENGLYGDFTFEGGEPGAYSVHCNFNDSQFATNRKITFYGTNSNNVVFANMGSAREVSIITNAACGGKSVDSINFGTNFRDWVDDGDLLKVNGHLKFFTQRGHVGSSGSYITRWNKTTETLSNGLIVTSYENNCMLIVYIKGTVTTASTPGGQDISLTTVNIPNDAGDENFMILSGDTNNSCRIQTRASNKLYFQDAAVNDSINRKLIYPKKI